MKFRQLALCVAVGIVISGCSSSARMAQEKNAANPSAQDNSAKSGLTDGQPQQSTRFSDPFKGPGDRVHVSQKPERKVTLSLTKLAVTEADTGVLDAPSLQEFGLITCFIVDSGVIDFRKSDQLCEYLKMQGFSVLLASELETNWLKNDQSQNIGTVELLSGLNTKNIDLAVILTPKKDRETIFIDPKIESGFAIKSVPETPKNRRLARLFQSVKKAN